MPYDPERHHRRSIRLKGYDYTQSGAYFFTIVTQDRMCLFGDVAGGDMQLGDAGAMVQTVWDEIPGHYPGVDIDAFVVMPNHIHGIIVLIGVPAVSTPSPEVGAGPRTRPGSVAPDLTSPDETGGQLGPPRGQPPGQPRGVAPTVLTLSLPDVVHRFKTLTTKRYTDGVRHHGWAVYPGRLWHRNYYEHIIRDQAGLNQLRQYIADNPARWAEDDENPTAPNHLL
jgi:REP element-mobilizing transposase RayT